MNTLKTFVARCALACAALSAAAAFSQDARACGDVFIPEIDQHRGMRKVRLRVRDLVPVSATNAIAS